MRSRNVGMLGFGFLLMELLYWIITGQGFPPLPQDRYFVLQVLIAFASWALIIRIG